MCKRNCSSCRKPPPGCARCCAPSVVNCIFDLESAVFDTRHIYQRACIELVASYNRTIPEALLMRIAAMETQEMAELICHKCKIPLSWEMFLLLVNERAAEMIANPPLMNGVEKLLRHLDKCCIRMALVTSCPSELFLKKIRGQEELFELFCTILCADDPDLVNSLPKPEPDILLKAMHHLGEATRDSTLVFDGSLKGLQAANDARLPVIMPAERDLPCCWSELATKRLETLEEFQPEEFGIPPYKCDEPPPSPVKKTKQRKSKQTKGPRRNSVKSVKDEASEANEEQAGEEEQE
ncbi:uncharacterized protein Dwil_GK14950 [Drosophila willistoni]|uniref:Pseudouridine-5'-phosphatase n=1 Tax=Drosophila willistoni TaxID=7260 RepID=B4MW37_DROWI|nr:probable pseudouridine-5'-phosphatase [Drosophila willistoni]EDW75907.1 uncharacterized protein Dwil_GK14950 [Drosophila willistoni]